MNNIENRPLLSLCLSGRNDNYGFNFKRRFVQAMNFLAWSARRAGVEKQIEVVFADWNSEIPLSRTIRLSDGAAKMVRFLEIPPDLAARYNPSFSPFSQSVAFNAALRRAKGAYLGMMPADILLTSYALRNLIGILSGTIPVPFDPRSAVISVPRKNIPFYAEEAHDFSSPERTEALLLAGDAWMLCDNTARGMMGSYGVFILERSLFFSLRGTDERIAGWGYNDIDLALRCADRASVMNMMGYGVWSYDFEPSFRMLVQKEKRRTVFHPIRLGHAENPENWGLADLTLSESRAESGSEHLPSTSPRPDTLAWRDWIFWLSQRISPSVVPFFSSCAMLAAWTAAEKTPKRIFLYGTADRSIVTLLSLAVPFAEILIHETYETAGEFERIWKDDNAFGPLHHVGPVRYFPSLEMIHPLPGDLIVLGSRMPSMEVLIKNCSGDSCVILSSALADHAELLFPEELGFSCFHVRGNLLFRKPEGVEVLKLKQISAPMNGNLLSRLLAPLLRRHASKIRKLWNLFFRQELFLFPHFCRVIRSIRK